ncbi:MAG: SH3 domain-containing protein [Chloroflexi bacterium]|nr:SH3 domain-containing protein [Chloroflexota bacterium]
MFFFHRFAFFSSAFFCLILLALWPVNAQSDHCPALVATALANVDALCAETGRNQACYGNLRLDAQAQPDTALQFAAPGDIADIASLTLSGMDASVPQWGIAFLQLQANLPDTLPGQNITMLLFGDTALTPAPPLAEVTLTVAGSENIRVRARPDSQSDVLEVLPGGAAVTANGRTADGDWLRLALADGRIGWAAAFLFVSTDEINTLAVVGADDAVYAPLQAFYFRSGLGDAPCAAAPRDGMLIQTPEGAGSVTLLLNNVRITFGSTAYVQSPGDTMTVHLLEGQAQISALAGAQDMLPGTSVSVALDENGVAAAAPQAPVPYTPDEWGTLPLDTLPRAVEMAAPLTDCTIVATEAVNTRSGPGTVYERTGTLEAGTTTTAVAQAQATNGMMWLQLADGGWVRADVVQSAGCAALPVTADIPPPPAPAAPSAGTGGIEIHIGSPYGCTPDTVAVGIPLTFEYGMGYADEAAATAGLADAWGLTVNGTAVAVSTVDVLFTGGPDYSDWGIVRRFYWGVQPPGSYSVSIVDRGDTSRGCTLTITP